MENSDILIREITRKSEIVDNSTWVLVNDGGSNVLLHRASKDVAKALSDGMRCYYVSPDVFVGDFHFDNVLFTERPNGLSVDVSFRMKLLPEMSGFADWVKTNVGYKLTTGEFVERMSKPKYGLKQFLQHSLEGVTNFDLLRKHGKEAVPTFAGQDKSVEPWLYVVGMQWIEADDIPASKRNWLKEFSAQQEERTKELEQMRADLSFATEKGNLADAMKIVAQRLKLNYLAREVECRKAEGALKDVEIENANKELELLERKKKISILSKDETDRYVDLVKVLKDYQSAQKKIEELEDEIRRLSAWKDKEDPDAWYNNLSRKGKIFRHVRTIFACCFYVFGWAFFLIGCSIRSKSFESLSPIFTDFAFVKTAVCWFAAMLLNSKNVNNTIKDVKDWIGNLLCGRPAIDIAYVIGSFFRYFAGCYLSLLGLFAFYWLFFGLFVWAYIGFQRDYFVGFEVMFMAISGIGLGAYVLGMKLMMRRRILASANATRKWIMIMGLPMLLFFFFDKTAMDRFKWPNEDKKATKAAINEFKNKNFAKAWKFVEKADKDDPVLCTYLGDAFSSGDMGVVQNDDEAFRWYRKAAEKGDVVAQYNVGVCFRTGRGVATNMVEAANWNRRAAERGMPRAQMTLGRMYEKGGDYKNAIIWYERAANQGDVDAQFLLGLMYEEGKGLALKDEEAAVKWYGKAAEQGHASAQLNLAVMYKEGRGVPEIDRNKSIKYIKQSLIGGNEFAKIFLSSWLQEDKEYALLWYIDAAQNGDAVAANKVGVMYYNEVGVKKNDAKAIEWFSRSAEQGYAIAQYNLGVISEKNKNYENALLWYERAMKNGNKDAKEAVGRIRKIMR